MRADAARQIRHRPAAGDLLEELEGAALGVGTEGLGGSDAAGAAGIARALGEKIGCIRE